jgi:hypothetical protein
VAVEGNNIDIQKTGSACTVPSDDYANLMYYLSCVESVTTLDFGKLSDYKHYELYNNINFKKSVVILAALFDPLTLNQLGCFQLVDDDVIDHQNEFYKINQTKFAAIASEDIVIGSYKGKITEIMLYNIRWIRESYLNPMENVSHILTEDTSPSLTYSPRTHTEDYHYTPSYSSRTHTDDYHYTPSYSRSKDSCPCCGEEDDKDDDTDNDLLNIICCQCCNCIDCNVLRCCYKCKNGDPCNGWVLFLYILCSIVFPLGILVYLYGFLEGKFKVKAAGIWGFITGLTIVLI